MLGDRSAGIVDGALMHVPFETVVACRDVALKSLADCTVAIGGGSTTGLAKALALEDGLPIVAVPPTYAGSEMTPIWGMTKDRRTVPGSSAERRVGKSVSVRVDLGGRRILKKHINARDII